MGKDWFNINYPDMEEMHPKKTWVNVSIALIFSLLIGIIAGVML